MDNTLHDLSKFPLKETLFDKMPNQHVIHFHKGQEVVGKLDLSGEKITFTGNVDESAKVFFDAVISNFESFLKNKS